MRLTLRTLLAYMDEILDPEDAQQIAKKIADSPVATDLMHRIRDVMRRLRLGAPSVLDRTAGLDPNTVAEYLDNTLSDAQLPDFEKICLESDVQLAEVASCHRILALVLGEPAEVDPASREKVYQLPHVSGTEAEEPPPLVPPALAASPAPPPLGTAESAESTGESRIPSYLREPPAGRRWRLFVGVGAVVFIGIALLALSGQFGGRNLLAEFLGSEPPAAEQRGVHGTERPAAPAAFSGSAPASANPPTEGASPGATTPTSAKTATSGVQTPSSGSPGSETAPGGPKSQPTTGASPGDREAPKAESGKKATGQEPPGSEGPAAPKGKSPAIPGPPASKQERPGETAVTTPLAKDVDRAGAGLSQPPGATGADVRPKSPGPLPGGNGPTAVKPSVGRLVSTREVLLTFVPQPVPQPGVWSHLPGQAPLYSGDNLLSLPAFRPVIALVGQVKVQLIDGTSVQILPLDSQRVAGLAINYGRILLKADEAGGARLRLQFGQRTVLVTLQSVESTLAIEARRQVVPGVDPETQPGPVVADLYATSGKIGWQDEAGQPPIILDAPTHRAWGQQPGEPEADQQFPKWVNSDTTSPLDQRGALLLEQWLSSGRPANLVLRELVDFRLKEVRSLAVRSRALLGDFEPLLRALDDPDQKLYWDDYIAQLRAGVTRGPASAATVRSTMERFYGPQGANLYEMLWKYGPSLSNAEARQLTQFLDHQKLAFRVLAFWNLKAAFGGMTLHYRPEDPLAKRQTAALAWRERLKTPAALRDIPPARGGKAIPREAPTETGPPSDGNMP